MNIGAYAKTTVYTDHIANHLRSLGHTVTQHTVSEAPDLTGYEIVFATMLDDLDNQAAILRNALDAGVPIGMCTQQYNTSQVYTGLLNRMRLTTYSFDETNKFNNGIYVLNAFHPITDRYSETQTVQLYTTAAYAGALQIEDQFDIGTTLAADTGYQRPNTVAIEVGTPDVDGVPTAAKVFASGSLNEKEFTAAGKLFLEDVLDWLATPAEPDKPWVYVTDITGVSATATSSAYNDPGGRPHLASRWQVQVAGGDWSSPVIDSGWDLVNLLEYELTRLTPGVEYQVRVSHRNQAGFDSAWSTTMFVTDPDTGVITEITLEEDPVTGEVTSTGGTLVTEEHPWLTSEPNDTSWGDCKHV